MPNPRPLTPPCGVKPAIDSQIPFPFRQRLSPFITPGLGTPFFTDEGHQNDIATNYLHRRRPLADINA